MHPAGHWPWLSHQEGTGNCEALDTMAGCLHRESWVSWTCLPFSVSWAEFLHFPPSFHASSLITSTLVQSWGWSPWTVSLCFSFLEPIIIQLKEASSRNRGLEQRKRLGCSLAYLTVTCLVQPSQTFFLARRPNNLLFLWQGQFPTMLALGGSILPQPCQIFDSLH